MWLLYKLNETKSNDMTDESKEEYSWAPGNQNCSPYASQSDDALWVVEIAIDATIGQLWAMVKEEIPKEPAEFA